MSMRVEEEVQEVPWLKGSSRVHNGSPSGSDLRTAEERLVRFDLDRQWVMLRPPPTTPGEYALHKRTLSTAYQAIVVPLKVHQLTDGKRYPSASLAFQAASAASGHGLPDFRSGWRGSSGG